MLFQRFFQKFCKGQDKNSRKQVAKSVLYSNEDAWTQISFTVPIEAATDYAGAVTLKQNELIAQTIACDPADFDKVWDTYIKAINDAGMLVMWGIIDKDYVVLSKCLL